MNLIRILIADDHTLFREGVRALLNAAPDTEVVGEAADGDEAITLAAEHRPDIILMDLQMPRTNGVEATRRVLLENPGIGVIVLTMFDDDDSVFTAMRAGARGYVLKGADKDEMLRAIRAVAHGEALFGSAIAVRLMSFFGDTRERNRSTITTPVFPELTDRERELLTLIAQGMNNLAISEQLHLSPKTVSNHISSIFNKLQVADRAQAIVRARKAGLG